MRAALTAYREFRECRHFDQVAAGSFDHAGGGRPAQGQGDVVGEVGLSGGEVGGGALRAATPLRVEAGRGTRQTGTERDGCVSSPGVAIPVVERVGLPRDSCWMRARRSASVIEEDSQDRWSVGGLTTTR